MLNLLFSSHIHKGSALIADEGRPSLTHLEGDAQLVDVAFGRLVPALTHLVVPLAQFQEIVSRVEIEQFLLEGRVKCQ